MFMEKRLSSTNGQISESSIASISVRLLRTGATRANALRADHDLAEVASEFGTVFLGQTNQRPPPWADFIDAIAPGSKARLSLQSCSAVLLLEAGASGGKRLFAICFGQGHHALDDDRIERSFGLRVVLNSVTRGRLRTLDTANLNTTVMQRRVQASRESDLLAFGIDTNSDLLRLASGIPTGTDFAKALSGKDALHLRVRVSAANLVALCVKALKLYKAKTYQADFAFIDHVVPVEDGKLLATLDAMAFAELAGAVQGSAPSDLHLAIPDILAPESSFEVEYFGTGMKSGIKQRHSELTINDYVSELRKGDFAKITDMAALRASHEVRVADEGDETKQNKRKVYNCFVLEVTLQKKHYVLFDAQWFFIDDKYFDSIEATYNSLKKPSFLAATTAKNEQELIADLKKDALYLCLDQTRSAPKGAPTAALEACDFLSRSKQLIHLKDGHGSAPLSHLWNQALVATESFVRDETFREGFRKAIKNRQRMYARAGFLALLPQSNKRVTPADYTIVFGVMRHPYARSGDLGLPFFSKVALRAVAERLLLMAFQVELHLIEKK